MDHNIQLRRNRPAGQMRTEKSNQRVPPDVNLLSNWWFDSLLILSQYPPITGH